MKAERMTRKRENALERKCEDDPKELGRLHPKELKANKKLSVKRNHWYLQNCEFCY